MTLPEATRLLGYWEEAPPVHVLVRRMGAAWGFDLAPTTRARRARPAEKFQESNRDEVAAFVQRAHKAAPK